MPPAVIENPILNSPFTEPRRHFRFGPDGITNEIVEARRVSSYFVPIPRSKSRNKQQLLFDTEWTQERVEENLFINEVRGYVSAWRQRGYHGVGGTTRRLLEHWQSDERERRLFFCQVEALETAIYLTEVAPRDRPHVGNRLREFNASSNPKLDRIAFKMATGSGKTVVMAMLIAWQALNKLANSSDGRFSDTFLVVTPGITIRDRLRVLLPNDPANYYRALDLVPPDLLEELHKARILITNFHAFRPREQVSAGKLTKAILAGGSDAPSPFTETPDQMVRRVCRELGNKKNIIVLNDEAHHCYRRKPDGEEVKLVGDERIEAKRREEEARIWISGLEAVKAKLGIKVVYDLSATPFFLRGSGYSEGTLFPWVVSDFSLIDAIESGIVKVPRVPVADDAMHTHGPTYRDLWLRIRDDLPKKGRGAEQVSGDPTLPSELEGALRSLYSNYEKQYRRWEANAEARAAGRTPPVFIVVCNNTNVSKLVYDFIAGRDKKLDKDTTIPIPGKLDIFSNVRDGRWLERPNTILIDSEQLESGDAMSPEFKKLAAREIEEFKSEYRLRFPGRDVDSLTDEDLLREVMNTVGKPGKLGEQVKCVVSVSMLTEGWDANTVTHILGVRAFGTQLLCEQVVGRGLRRMSYVADDNGMFAPEYAEVYGVPFSFIPTSGSSSDPKPGPIPTRVRALEERIACEITFPRLLGYRYDIDGERLPYQFSADTTMVLSAADFPTWTENAPIVGESIVHTLDDLRARRPQEVAFWLAKTTLERALRDDNDNLKPWLFPQLLNICRRWLDECLTLKDNMFVQMLLLTEPLHAASEKVAQALFTPARSALRLKPILRPFDTLGSTRYVDFDTTKPVYVTDPAKCHISHVVADTGSWEQKMAQTQEELPEVVCYVKNQNLGFVIPYSHQGNERGYIPDFIARIDDGHGPHDLLNLIVEVSGAAKADKAAKVSTARNLWVPAVNNHGGYGRWAFVEVSDPWDAGHTIRATLAAQPATLESP
ncbi:MAG: restriction endonuclease subunit R [Chloroflexi bacterium]|nr:MAG: restriction endonuclease subunit R [Chloroflexota bacterium]